MSCMNRILLLSVAVCLATTPLHAAEQASGESPAETKGPNGGVLLQQGDTSVELLIFERGVPPEYRAWVTRNDRAVTEDIDLSVELTRLGGQIDTFGFDFQGAYWLGDGVVREPHSFDVAVSLATADKNYRWLWESHEGRIVIDADIAEEAGIRTEEAAAGRIERSLTSYGRLVPDPDRVAEVTGRFPGQVKNVAVRLGDAVEAGDTLATIESNASLQPYALRAPIAGTVTQRTINIGELTRGQSLFTIANLNTLWAELRIFPGQRSQVRGGQSAQLTIGKKTYGANILHLLPSPGNAPHVIARVAIDNADGLLSSGQLVSAEVVVESDEVPLVVDNRALQQFRDGTVVFIRVDDTYEIRPLELGRSDGRFTEVLSGLKPGDTYVVENSYLIKADIEKSGASHDH